MLVRNRLRDRVALRTDGGLQTGRDVVVAALLGAEEYGFGTAALVAIGCDMARQCHLDTCPTGIATQREDLRAKFTGTPDQVVAFFTALAEDVRRELAALGLRSLGEAVGRTDLLRGTDAALDLRPAARRARPGRPADDEPPKDRPLLGRSAGRRSFEAAALADLAGACSRRRGRCASVRRVTPATDRSARGWPVPSSAARSRVSIPRVRYELTGSAGQSLGAFAVAGMRIEVTGEANDYVGQGAARRHRRRPAARRCAAGPGGGRQRVPLRRHRRGAPPGRPAGMRFAVRNSGARAVVEGIGAHGCEYMTGGTVVVLGTIGPNFGAGMTGGRAYLLDATLDRLNAGVRARDRSMTTTGRSSSCSPRTPPRAAGWRGHDPGASGPPGARDSWSSSRSRSARLRRSVGADGPGSMSR